MRAGVDLVVVERGGRTIGYAPPGWADQLSDELVGRWNAQINSAYQALEPRFGSRFFSVDPEAVGDPITVQLGWFGDPAEPRFCLDQQRAQQLSDWGCEAVTSSTTNTASTPW